MRYSFGIVIAELLTGSLQVDDGIEYGLDTKVDELVPDKRLIDNPFPAECQQVLQELILNCLKSPERRISTMAAVMRQLLDLEKRYCVRTEFEAHYVSMVHGIEEELQQLRLSSLKRLPSVEESICISCNIQCSVDNGVKCTSDHFLCNGCFGSAVTNQLSSEYRASFEYYNSEINSN